MILDNSIQLKNRGKFTASDRDVGGCAEEGQYFDLTINVRKYDDFVVWYQREGSGDLDYKVYFFAKDSYQSTVGGGEVKNLPRLTQKNFDEAYPEINFLTPSGEIALYRSPESPADPTGRGIIVAINELSRIYKHEQRPVLYPAIKKFERITVGIDTPDVSEYFLDYASYKNKSVYRFLSDYYLPFWFVLPEHHSDLLEPLKTLFK